MNIQTFRPDGTTGCKVQTFLQPVEHYEQPIVTAGYIQPAVKCKRALTDVVLVSVLDVGRLGLNGFTSVS